jgi:peptidoglycan/LPS O-acetylase OafA/YrhL
MTTPHVKQRKNSDIEALRALAIVLVIFAHIALILSPQSLYWNVLADYRFGYGVDIFFCVSGFIITKSIASEIPASRSFRDLLELCVPFWVRRFWRLMPSALFWIAVSLLLSYLYGGKGVFLQLEIFVHSALAAALQYMNVVYAVSRDTGTLGDAGIYWSLSLENQFYLVLPIIAVLAGRRWMPAVFIAVFLAQFFLTRQLIRPTPELWAFRTDAISLGVLLALWHGSESYQRLEPTFLKNKAVVVLLLAAMIWLLAALTAPNPPLPFAMGLTAVGSGLLVWVASYNKDYLTPNRALAALCNYIGSRSYAIYLTHVIALSLVRHWFFAAPGDTQPTPFDGGYTALYIGVFVAVTLLFSEFNYRYIENPMRRHGEKLSRNLKSRFAVA